MKKLAYAAWIIAFLLTGVTLASDIQFGKPSSGGVSFPLAAGADCVTPEYGFSGLAGAGLCHDDGTGPYAVESVAVQTSDPTDFEYTGLQSVEAGNHFSILAAFDQAAAVGSSIFMQSSGALDWSSIVMSVIDGTNIINFDMTANGAGGDATMLWSVTNGTTSWQTEFSAGDEEKIETLTDGSETVTQTLGVGQYDLHADDGGTATGDIRISTSQVEIEATSDGVLIGSLIFNGDGVQVSARTFANLAAASNGTYVYCSDCLKGSTPCSGASTGSRAWRENGAWNCD